MTTGRTVCRTSAWDLSTTRSNTTSKNTPPRPLLKACFSPCTVPGRKSSCLIYSQQNILSLPFSALEKLSSHQRIMIREYLIRPELYVRFQNPNKLWVPKFKTSITQPTLLFDFAKKLPIWELVTLESSSQTSTEALFIAAGDVSKGQLMCLAPNVPMDSIRPWTQCKLEFLRCCSLFCSQ